MQKIFKLIIIVLCVFFTKNLHSTIQIPDKIFYNSKEFEIDFPYVIYPLQSYLAVNKDIANIIDDLTEFYSTGLSRGYIATFSIIDSKLYLINLEVCDSGKSGEKTIFHELFPELNEVFISTFSGSIILPDGMYEPIIGEPIKFNKYLIINFNCGNLIKSFELNHKEFLQWQNSNSSKVD